MSDSWWKFVFGVAPEPDGHSIMRRGQAAARPAARGQGQVLFFVLSGDEVDGAGILDAQEAGHLELRSEDGEWWG